MRHKIHINLTLQGTMKNWLSFYWDFASCWLDSSMGTAAVQKPEDASLNPLQCLINMHLIFRISKDVFQMMLKAENV